MNTDLHSWSVFQARGGHEAGGAAIPFQCVGKVGGKASPCPLRSLRAAVPVSGDHVNREEKGQPS